MKCAGIVLSLACIPALSGCAGLSPVALELPVNRMETPERSAGVVSFGSGVSGESYLVLTPDDATSPPDTQHPHSGHCPSAGPNETNWNCSSGIYFRGDARLGDVVQIGM